MTPEEIARGIVEKWWPLSATMMGDIRLREAIASAIRAEREIAEKAETERDRLRAERDSLMMRVNHGTPKDACYSTDDDPNCPLEHLWITRNGDLRAERDRLREALERIMTNEVRAHHDFRIDACHIASEALARVKGESHG